MFQVCTIEWRICYKTSYTTYVWYTWCASYWILRKTALTNAETSQNLVALDLIKQHVCYITYKWIIRHIIKDLARNHRSHHILNIKLIKWRWFITLVRIFIYYKVQDLYLVHAAIKTNQMCSLMAVAEKVPVFCNCR